MSLSAEIAAGWGRTPGFPAWERPRFLKPKTPKQGMPKPGFSGQGDAIAEYHHLNVVEQWGVAGKFAGEKGGEMGVRNAKIAWCGIAKIGEGDGTMAWLMRYNRYLAP